jgi:aminoglycoside 2''-phosphotransferase
MTSERTDPWDTYRARIAALYPDIEIVTCEGNDSSQNNDVVTINGSLIVRFPRYPQGIEVLRTEVCLLSVLGRDPALPIPRPTKHSLDSGRVGEVFMGYTALPGMPLLNTLYATLPDDARRRLVADLGHFLRRLHSQPVAELDECGLTHRAPLQHWEELYGRITARLFPFMDAPARAWTVQHFERFLQDERHSKLPQAIVHGDLGGSNILIDPHTGALTGVIDFSSTHLDDPAVDLAAASTIGSEFLTRMATSYPLIATASTRIRFYRGTFALQEALFGVETGDSNALQAGLADVPGQHRKDH